MYQYISRETNLSLTTSKSNVRRVLGQHSSWEGFSGCYSGNRWSRQCLGYTTTAYFMQEVIFLTMTSLKILIQTIDNNIQYLLSGHRRLPRTVVKRRLMKQLHYPSTVLLYYLGGPNLLWGCGRTVPHLLIF